MVNRKSIEQATVSQHHDKSHFREVRFAFLFSLCVAAWTQLVPCSYKEISNAEWTPQKCGSSRCWVAVACSYAFSAGLPTSISILKDLIYTIWTSMLHNTKHVYIHNPNRHVTNTCTHTSRMYTYRHIAPLWSYRQRKEVHLPHALERPSRQASLVSPLD